MSYIKRKDNKYSKLIISKLFYYILLFFMFWKLFNSFVPAWWKYYCSSLFSSLFSSIMLIAENLPG